jgi:hypothetical protein
MLHKEIYKYQEGKTLLIRQPNTGTNDNRISKRKRMGIESETTNERGPTLEGI